MGWSNVDESLPSGKHNLLPCGRQALEIGHGLLFVNFACSDSLRQLQR